MTTAKKSYLDEKELKRLENYLESPVETTRLVLIDVYKRQTECFLDKIFTDSSLG